MRLKRKNGVILLVLELQCVKLDLFASKIYLRFIHINYTVLFYVGVNKT